MRDDTDGTLSPMFLQGSPAYFLYYPPSTTRRSKAVELLYSDTLSLLWGDTVTNAEESLDFPTEPFPTSVDMIRTKFR